MLVGLCVCLLVYIYIYICVRDIGGGAHVGDIGVLVKGGKGRLRFALSCALISSLCGEVATW